MGRARVPLEQQKGNLTKEEQQEKELLEAAVKIPANQLKRPPAWLRDEVAKKEWKRLVKQFEEIDVIGNLDYNNLGAYCNAFSSFVEIGEKMKTMSFVTVHTNKAGAKNVVANPLIQLQMKYSEEIRKYSALLGLSIDSRLKMGALKINKEKGEIDNEFGNI